MSRYILFFKAKQQQEPKKSRGKTKSREGIEAPRGGWASTAMAATTARGGHHGQAVVASGQGALASLPCCVLVHVLVHGFCLYWFILGLFFYLL